ncbi:MAG: alpha/beta hydrolase [bacterium]|nr:alpha/beta hydrolase [bacterium]
MTLHSDFVDLSTGARFHYVDTDPGDSAKPVALLLHGMLGTAELHFPNVIEWLRPDYRVVGPSLRGYGQSTPKPRDFPVDFYERDARDVVAFMNALGSGSVHVLGYSDGGEVALLAASYAPERFKSVVTWGAVGYFGPAMRPVAQRMYPPTWMTEEEKVLHGITDPDAFVLGWIHAVRHIIDSGGDLSLSLAEKISAPLLLMLGDQDTLNPAEYGQRLVDRASNGRLQIFECGHPVHDQQWEAFKAAVGPFLQAAEAQG